MIKHRKDIAAWIEGIAEKHTLSLIRVRCGKSASADTVAMFTIDGKYIPKGEHVAIHVSVDDLNECIWDVLQDNEYGTENLYMRLHAHAPSGSGIGSLQRSIKATQQVDNQPIDYHGRSLEMLTSALRDMTKNLNAALVTMSDTLAHREELTIRMVEAMIEAKEERVEVESIALQSALYSDLASSPEASDPMREKAVESFGTLAQAIAGSMNGHAHNGEKYRPTPEEMKEYVREDPSYAMGLAKAWSELQQEATQQQSASNDSKTNDTPKE